ncbi:MAG TPA: hypothetical protein VLZ89_04150, partial [Anaerolineales bacterium]|nr:hypothetical protein [Anaerolineales bacterium]
MKRYYVLLVVVSLVTAALACNLPSAAPAQSQGSSQVPATTATASSETAATPGSSPIATELPVTATAAINHLMTPADIHPKGTLIYDVDSSGTASQHRAPYGDSYNIGLFERPFTQKDMTY